MQNLRTYAEYKKFYPKEDYIIFFKIKFKKRQNQYVVKKIRTAVASRGRMGQGEGLTRKSYVKYCWLLCPEFRTQDEEFAFLIGFQKVVLDITH